MAVVIGVSGSHNVTDRQIFVRENYMDSVLRAGGIPVLLPEVEDEDTIEQMLDSLDGILLAGGGDVNPARYGEEMLPACGEADEKRDTFEFKLVAQAMKRRMPIFGICRGSQVLAAAMGGTLFQDIESQKGIPAEHHSQKPPYGEAVHRVCLKSGGLFERITGVKEVQTNSMHHQAVKDAGPNLVVEGTAEDGVIEAFSARECDNIFAVQFHPEYLSDHDKAAQKMFNHLVSLAEIYHQKKA